jgi:iron complex outermembrane receptor protein
MARSVAVFLVLLVIGSARGEEAADSELAVFELEREFRVSATKTDTPAEETPAIVEVVTRHQIREWGYSSVAEVLSHIVGFYVIDDHTQPNVAVRGVSGGLFAESGILKVMIDGHSVAFRSTAGNWLGEELVPLSAVERIEIIRGPASALYGADAFLGVINIITRSGEQLQGAAVWGGYGVQTLKPTLPQADLDVTIGGRKGPFELLGGVRYHQSDLSGLRLPASSPAPSIPDYNAGNRVASGLDRTTWSGLLRLTYHIGANSSLSLVGYLSTLDAGGEFSPWTQLAHGLDASGRLNENRLSLFNSSVALAGRFQLTPKVKLLIDAFYFLGGPGFTGRDRIEVGSDVFYVKRRFGFQGVDSNAELQWDLPRAIRLVGGVGVVIDDEQQFAGLHVLKYDVSSTEKAGSILNAASAPSGDRLLSNFGAYLQGVWTPIASLLTLTGGLRFDYHNIYGSQASGRLAAVSSPRSNLHIKLLYGSAFKAPSPLLLYGVPYRAGDVIGNPALRPQYVHTVELELTYQALRWLNLRTGLAYNYLVDAAEFTLQGVNQVAINIGQVHALSWESRIDLTFNEWLRGYLSAEVNHTIRDTGEIGYRQRLIGDQNVLYPQAIVHAGALTRIPKIPISVGAQVSYVGPRRASESNILSNGASYDLPGQWLLDATIATVGLKLIENHELVLQVVGKNLLGSVGPDPGFAGVDYPFAPRTIFFQLRHDL